MRRAIRSNSTHRAKAAASKKHSAKRSRPSLVGEGEVRRDTAAPRSRNKTKRRGGEGGGVRELNEKLNKNEVAVDNECRPIG